MHSLINVCTNYVTVRITFHGLFLSPAGGQKKTNVNIFLYNLLHTELSVGIEVRIPRRDITMKCVCGPHVLRARGPHARGFYAMNFLKLRIS